MTTAPSNEWADGVRRVQTEAQGVLRLWLVTPDDAAALSVASLLGDQLAAALLRATAHCATNVMRNSHKKRPALCLCCPRAVRSLEGVVFCVAVPETASPENALGGVVCPRCAASADDLKARAIQALRRVWPDLREVNVMPGSGALN